MRFTVTFIFCLLSIQNINSTVMLNCALGLVEKKQCPVDGGWSLWTTWSNCEGQCSSVGRQVRTRNCSNPLPSNNGVDCVGNQFEVKGCGVAGCSFEQYEKLLAQDSNHLQQLKLLKQASGSQNALLTKCLLSHCSFETISQTLGKSGTKFWSALQCVKKNTGCPIAGGWGDWSEWSRCSALCGQGLKFRCHVCCDPPPSSNQTSCHGESCEFQPCTGTHCGQSQKLEGAWSNWSHWSTCSAPCRLGVTRRSRTCQQGNQKKAKKSLQTNNEELRSFDYMDYYDNYFDYNYGQQEEENIYKEKEFVKTGQPSKLKKRADGTCDTKIEYYSTEDDDEYSITFSKSLVGTSSMQVSLLTTNKVQNVQNIPESTQSKHSVSTTSLEHLLFASIKPTTEIKYPQTDEVKSERNYPQTVDVTSGHRYPHTVEVKSGHSYPHTVEVKSERNYPQTVEVKSEHNYPQTVEVKSGHKYPHTSKITSTTILLENSQTNIIENYKACSEPMSVICTKHSKPSKNLGKPHTKGKGKSAKNNYGCKSSTFLSVSTNLQTDKPVETCDSETDSTGEQYPTESDNIKETTVFERSDDCTDKLQKGDKEEEISMFGNIDINEKYAKGEQKSDERHTDKIESTVNERKTDEPKSTMWLQPTSKTTCTPIEPEDDILNLGKVLTVQPKKGLAKTSKYPISISDINESLKSTSSTFTSRNGMENNQSHSNWPSFTSSSIASIEKNGLNFSSGERTTTDEDLDFDNSSVITNQNSCDIKKILQLPSYNNSFIADDCKGPFEEIKPCNTKPCIAEGGWSSWSAWSPCSQDCGLGKQVSTRSCTQPEPVKDGSSCKGETTRKRSCYEHICPVKVATPRAMMMSGESFIKYDILNQRSSVFLLYIRFQHFNCSGSLVSRKSSSHCESDQKCDQINISLYNCYIFLIIRKEKCYSYLLSTVHLSIGEWHEVLITIVGATVTMRLDDSFLTHSQTLSCRPLAPNFDSTMKVGGHFIGEIDRLRINFKNYNFQKKHTKRYILSENEENVEPEEISQVQFSLNKEETTTLNLALFLHAPCFVNESFWRVEVALKPEFSEGLVLFFRGYNKGEFVIVTLEHSRVRLRVKVLTEAGECEQPTDIAPLTWIHVAVSKPAEGPVGLTVNGGERCVVSFSAAKNDTQEPSLRCTAGIFLGEVPTSVKRELNSEDSDSLNSPLGLLGSLTIDNHTLDLSRLPHKVTSDISSNHSTKLYKFSSDMASITVRYEEMFVLEEEPFSLVCVYDLSSEQARSSSNKSGGDIDLSEYLATWIKLDLPVETAFETSGSNITYHITDNGKSTSLNVTRYTDFKSIEGFYSCWLQYPLPLQPGLNIITYSVVVITDHQDESLWTKITTIFNIIFILVLLLVFIIWVITEAILNLKIGSGFYRCKKIGYEEAVEKVRLVIFSKQGNKLLGDAEAANASYQRCLAQMDADMLVTEFEKAKNHNELEPFLSNVSDDDTSADDVKIITPDQNKLKGKEIKRPVNTIVGYVTEEKLLNPFSRKDKHEIVAEKSSNLRVIKGKVFDPNTVSIEDLQRSEDEDVLNEKGGGDGKDMILLRNYSINHSQESKKKQVGLIQKTSAYKSIENELKFKPEKFKFFNKYNNNNKGNK